MLRRLALQQESTEGVRDRQGVATATVLTPKPSFEIGAPNRIGTMRMLQRLAAGCGPLPFLSRHGQTVAPQNLSHRTDRRPPNFWFRPQQPGPEFHRPPMGVRRPRRQDGLLHILHHLIGMIVWRPGTVLERIQPALLISVQPFISGAPADAKTSANLRERPLLALTFVDEAQPLLHHRRLSPAHIHLFDYRRKTLSPIAAPGERQSCRWLALQIMSP